MAENTVVWNCYYDEFKTFLSKCVTYEVFIARKFNCSWKLKMEFTPGAFPRIGLCLIAEKGCNYIKVVSTLTGYKRYWKTCREMKVHCFTSTQCCHEVFSFGLNNLIFDHFKVRFEFENTGEILLNPFTSGKPKAFPVSKYEVLSADFQAMLGDESSTDMTIECGSTVLKVHKFILCARSPEFKAMLSEKRTNRITIDDLNCEVVKAMVQFMYCAHVVITSVTMAEGLLRAAEKYMISSLKEGVLEYVISSLSVGNALTFLKLADLYDVATKVKIVKYICDNFRELKQREEWKKFMQDKPMLAIELYEYSYNE